jgi:putative Mg2+ transporter-C (MgtC) family protein
LTTALAQIAQPFSYDWLEQMVVLNGAIGRLLLAAFLGGLVGLERELKGKSAGVRTNLLICMGAAFFTLLGSAASIWVVASIGMACGAGLYAAAAVGAFIVICSLAIVGLLEQSASIKAYPVTYEARGHDQPQMLKSILDAMDHVSQRLADIETDVIGESQRISFSLAATKRQHERLRTELRAKPEIGKLLTFRDPEDD